jgi:hypothetical protein
MRKRLSNIGREVIARRMSKTVMGGSPSERRGRK